MGLNTLNLDPDPELVSSVVDPVYFHLFFCVGPQNCRIRIQFGPGPSTQLVSAGIQMLAATVPVKRNFIMLKPKTLRKVS